MNMQEEHEHPDSDHDHSEPQDGENYTRYAILALVLYFVLWVPGFLVNAVYLARALGEERRTGRAPEGKTHLLVLLIAGLAVPLLAMCVLTLVSVSELG